MWKRPAAAALLIAWPVINHPSGFSVPKAAKSRVSPRPASSPELEAAKQAAEAIVKDPFIAAQLSATVSNLMNVLGNVQKVSDWFNSLNSAGKAWKEWAVVPKGAAFYSYSGNIDSHISALMETVNAMMQGGSNILISSEQVAEVPSQPVRGTYFENLTLGVLCDKTPGMSAIFAEAGTGKSVAVLLAVTEVARARPEELYVVLQDDLDTALRGFFRIDDMGFSATVARGLFFALRQRNITLHLFLDNMLDMGVRTDKDQSVLAGLARAANEHGQQIVFTTQFQEAAESIATINGDTTFMAELQDTSYGAYRWSANETEQLIRSLDGGDGTDTNERINQILEASKIPDWRGGWRPRSTKVFVKFGRKPSAPLKRAGWAGFEGHES